MYVWEMYRLPDLTIQEILVSHQIQAPPVKVS